MSGTFVRLTGEPPGCAEIWVNLDLVCTLRQLPGDLSTHVDPRPARTRLTLVGGGFVDVQESPGQILGVRA